MTRQASVGNLNSAKHLAHSQVAVRRLGIVQKRRLLRQIGLRAADLDGIGMALLDNWARAQSKVEAMDRWCAVHGWVDDEGQPPAFVAVYFAALNSARLSLGRFADHLKARGKAPSMVIDLQTRARRSA